MLSATNNALLSLRSPFKGSYPLFNGLPLMIMTSSPFADFRTSMVLISSLFKSFSIIFSTVVMVTEFSDFCPFGAFLTSIDLIVAGSISSILTLLPFSSFHIIFSSVWIFCPSLFTVISLCWMNLCTLPSFFTMMMASSELFPDV